MNIGDAARAAGVSAKMVRHYESVGLLPPAARTDAGYRQYGEKDVHTLQFIRRSRDLGFSIDEIRGLLSLWLDRGRPSRQVKAMAQAHIAELEQKAQAILAMKATLEHLVHCCKGDDRPGGPGPRSDPSDANAPVQGWLRTAMSPATRASSRHSVASIG